MKRLRSMRRRIPCLLWLLAASVWPTVPVHADPTPAHWYRVELIVFARLAPDAGAHETWPAQPGQPDLKDAVELTPPPGSAASGPGETVVVTPLGPVPYRELPSDQYQLDGAAKLLDASPRYRVLLHLAWQQPALDPRSAHPVHIQLPDGSLDGSVLLTRRRYLHAALDLLYRPGADSAAGPAGATTTNSTDGAGTTAPVVYRMQQHRRINSAALNYFDHPLFGVLLEATPIDSPTESNSP
ncbi:hypothetical protein BMS3Abin12_01649 [bacterium BMS3Abin12]|nr:hypothetical protein BMS3Abin12_01649 [bacterium BMS3Abin12]GBE50137.1 hypothetical protein BMS3Bbin13_01066 [bacterium BMS3Bbin13]